MKEIEIDGKHYDIDCSAFTMLEYRKKFDRGILKDIQTMQKFAAKQFEAVMKAKKENNNITEMELNEIASKVTSDLLDEYIEIVTKIAWICIYEVNKDIEEYENWMKNIKSLKIDASWVLEVTELAVNSFC